MIYRNTLTIPFQDIDAAGVVFFAHLFRYAHESYEAFMREIDQPLEKLLGEAEILLPLVHAEADYHRALHHAEVVTLEMVVESIGESSFCLLYRCMNSEGHCSATIKTVHVVRAAQTKQKAAIPANLRRGLMLYQITAAND